MTDAPCPVRIGTSGWTIPTAHRDAFAAEGSQLERYAKVFPTVEINSTFYRPHRAATLERWLATVPDTFRFAVKVTRKITHEGGFADAGELLRRFLDEIAPLAPKLGPLLVQLPPKLACDAQIAARFFAILREQFDGDVAFEPRHASWFTADADLLLVSFRVARVAADPAVVAEAARPGGSTALAYYRLHGSPRMYSSTYEAEALDVLAHKLAAHGRQGVPAWCFFDNTMHGFAIANSLATQQRIHAAQ